VAFAKGLPWHLSGMPLACRNTAICEHANIICEYVHMLTKIACVIVRNWRKLLVRDNTEVPAKRNDPAYMQITGDVKKEIGLKFKATCTLKQLSLGEGLEEAIKLWLNSQTHDQPQENKS
jgi:hypothetical protein